MGLGKTMTLVSLVFFTPQVHQLGQVTQGIRFSEAFYWNMNGRTRSCIARISGKVSLWPNMVQAGAYSATLHYLKAIQSLGTPEAKADGAGLVARMKLMPTDDDCFGAGSIRADGRKLHPAVLFEVKRADASQHEWDLLTPWRSPRPRLPPVRCGRVAAIWSSSEPAAAAGATVSRLGIRSVTLCNADRICAGGGNRYGRMAICGTIVMGFVTRIAGRARHADEFPGEGLPLSD